MYRLFYFFIASIIYNFLIKQITVFNFLKKTISHKGKNYTSEDLKILRENWEKENYSSNEYQLVDKYAIKSFELTEKQLTNLNKAKLSAKASSWKSRQRKLRKEGKLE